MKAFLIVIDGPMGAGKTTVAEALHKKLHKIGRLNALISLDRLKRIVSGYKMDSKIHLNLSSDIGIAMTKEYLKKNIDVIVEKAFTKGEYLESFIKTLNGRAKILVYQLEAPLDLRARRISKRKLHPEVKKRPPLSKIKRNTKHYNESKYEKAIIFDTSKLTPNTIVNKIIKDAGLK
ncbi:MAG TPA: AAA family ATPase [Candidatus Nanoarchaeia archaeon]|nr:AAA family ATPase [Candidatus Nanoarchaeia archaeon]